MWKLSLDLFEELTACVLEGGHEYYVQPLVDENRFCCSLELLFSVLTASGCPRLTESRFPLETDDISVFGIQTAGTF